MHKIRSQLKHDYDTAIVYQDVQRALAEDLGSGDISAALVASVGTVTAYIVTRSNACIAGIPWATESFRQLSDQIKLDWLRNDGEFVSRNETLAHISGPAAAILSAERTALNFLQLLSATASKTHSAVQHLSGSRTNILDTRKTIPGLRHAQKYAVRCGGGQNHRQGLYDAFLIKENHIAAAGDIATAVAQARQSHPDRLIEVEVESLSQLEQALATSADRVLLDNFSLPELHDAVKLTKDRCELEASGGIELEQLEQIAATGVHYVSLGTLTKDIKAIDLSLRILSK